eukprot:CAMPEP_0115584494 /NCGR_PEP_ID=MMETSP0272-20121206/6713_1 /TAXON_ID=71861 /ORGANISM="Scrippsiella trochoidea, Strain CCMP3099" /LENGTH=106 /DNA_ID=CAMNT_0003019531 /DNA_START=553 /DNA_END=871 /DNA_ORIENTATION=-
MRRPLLEREVHNAVEDPLGQGVVSSQPTEIHFLDHVSAHAVHGTCLAAFGVAFAAAAALGGVFCASGESRPNVTSAVCGTDVDAVGAESPQPSSANILRRANALDV